MTLVSDPHRSHDGVLSGNELKAANGEPLKDDKSSAIGAGGARPFLPAADADDKLMSNGDTADTILRLRSALSEVRSEAALERALARAAKKAAAQEMSDLRARLAAMHAKMTEAAPPVVRSDTPPSDDPSQRLIALQLELDALRSSTSWRLTAPLRAVASAVRGVGRDSR